MHRYVLLCYAMFCSAPIYSTQLYCSILHYTTRYTILYYAYALKRTWGKSAEEVYSNYTNARLQKGQHLHHHSKSLLLDSHILTKTLGDIEETHPKASLGSSSDPSGT